MGVMKYPRHFLPFGPARRNVFAFGDWSAAIPAVVPWVRREPGFADRTYAVDYTGMTSVTRSFPHPLNWSGTRSFEWKIRGRRAFLRTLGTHACIQGLIALRSSHRPMGHRPA